MANTNGRSLLSLGGPESDPAYQLGAHLKSSGVLDAPSQIAELSEQCAKLADQQRAVMKRLDELHAALTQVEAESVHKTRAVLGNLDSALRAMLVQKTPELAVTLQMPEQLVAKMETTPQDVSVNVEDRRAGFTDDQAELIGRSLAAHLAPVLKALADRPAAEVHHVDSSPALAAVERSLAALASRELPAPQVTATVDLAPLGDALKRQAKALRQLAEKIQAPNLEPLVEAVRKGMAEQQEAIVKSLSQKRKVTKLSQGYDGEWLAIEEVDE